jgi:hypothetical protein
MISSAETQKPRAKVLIGTPCYGGLCFVGYVASLLTSREYLKTKNIQIETCFLTNESLIPRGRNTIVAKFMTDPSFTHLLFIDGDITFNHLAIERLVNHDKDIVGALYPKKGYDWKKLKNCTDIINSENFERDLGKLKARLMNYTVNYTQDRQVVNGLLRVKHIGTGFMMIKREVVYKLMTQYPELKYDDDINILTDDENKWLYALFDCEVHRLGPKIHYLSEDYLFCKRWQDMGGEVHADITIPLTHTGTHSFGGNYLMSINFEPTAAQQEEQARSSGAQGGSVLQQATGARTVTKGLAPPPVQIPAQSTQFSPSQPVASPAAPAPGSDLKMNITPQTTSAAAAPAPTAAAPSPAKEGESAGSQLNRLDPRDLGKIEIVG